MFQWIDDACITVSLLWKRKRKDTGWNHQDVSAAVVNVGNGKLLAGSTSKRGKWTRTVEWTEKGA